MKSIAQQKTEVRDQRSEIRGQKSEVRIQRSEVNAKNILCGILLAFTGWAFWMLMYAAYQMAGGR